MKSFVIAKVLVINDAGEMLVLRRSQTDVRRPGQWDFPGGRVDAGEDMRQAAGRELVEETGLDLKNLRLVFAMSEVTPEHGSGTWLVFVTHVDRPGKVTLSYEHDEYDWKSPEAFVDEATYDRQIKMVKYVADNRLLDRE